MTIGMTALWIGVVASKPRTRMPSSSDGSRPSVSNATGLRIVFGLRPRDGRARGRRRAVTCGEPDAPPRADRRVRVVGRGARCCAVWEFKS